MIERHYSPAEIAERIGVSNDTVRRMFEHEPGVLVIETNSNARGRRYRTIRIPESVAERVLTRLANPGFTTTLRRASVDGTIGAREWRREA